MLVPKLFSIEAIRLTAETVAPAPCITPTSPHASMLIVLKSSVLAISGNQPTAETLSLSSQRYSPFPHLGLLTMLMPKLPSIESNFLTAEILAPIRNEMSTPLRLGHSHSADTITYRYYVWLSDHQDNRSRISISMDVSTAYVLTGS
jgi:hypothetical protein